MSRRGFTTTEFMVAIVVGLMVLSLSVSFLMRETKVFAAEEIRTEMNYTSKNIHKLFQRDLLTAGFEAANIDSVDAVSISSDTLTIRFSEIRSVRYYRGADNRLYREGTSVAHGIQAFDCVELADGSVKVNVDVGTEYAHPWVRDGVPVYRSYEWIFVPRNVYYSN